jgi:hypothetical protein
MQIIHLIGISFFAVLIGFAPGVARADGGAPDAWITLKIINP